MIWNNFDEFVAMGGYANYVWGACGVTFAVLLAEVILLRRRFEKACQAVRSANQDRQ